METQYITINLPGILPGSPSELLDVFTNLTQAMIVSAEIIGNDPPKLRIGFVPDIIPDLDDFMHMIDEGWLGFDEADDSASEE